MSRVGLSSISGSGTVNNSWAFVGASNISGNATATTVLTYSTFPASLISASGTLQASNGFGAIANLTGKATLQSYSVSPQTPGLAKFATLLATATLTSVNTIPNACECADWLNLLPTTCGWEVGSLENTTTVLTSGYDLPFALPVFRWHVLGETIETTTVVQSYDYGNLLSGVYKNPNSIICNTIRPATLAKQFKRQGCM
jgi:hypothetical protein